MAAATKRGRGRPRVEPILVFKAQSFIQGHFTQELSLRETAKAVNINPNYLSEKFKEVMGVNFVEYVARIRFANACDLVRNSKLSISEIAFAAGFQSLSQFNRVFKRFSGKSPRQYRAATVDALVA